MNVNALGGPHHPHNLRTTHLYAQGGADGSDIPTTNAETTDSLTPLATGSAEQPVTAEALDAVQGRRAERMAERDARFADRLGRMAEHRLDKVGEKLERIAAHHGLETHDIAGLEATFATAVDSLTEKLTAEGFQPGAVADFRHGVHGALAELRAGVRDLIAGSEASTEQTDETTGPEGVEGDPDGSSAVIDATDPVTESLDTTPVPAGPMPVGPVPVGSVVDGVTAPGSDAEADRVAVDLSDSALGLDVIADSVRITDAFSLHDTGPSIDIRA